MFKRLIFKFLLSNSSLIIVNSSEFKKKFKKYFNLNVTKIYNPISIKKNLKHKKLNIKNNFFEKNTLNILHIGRLVKEKNQSEIINAFSNIKNKERLRLLIIGGGPEKKI